MSSNLTPIDISNMPDLLDLVEEVESGNQPRELMRDNKPVVIITPIFKTKRSGGKEKRLSEAGAILMQTSSSIISIAGERKDHVQQ